MSVLRFSSDLQLADLMQPKDSADSIGAGADFGWAHSWIVGLAICFLLIGVVLRGIAAGDHLWLDEQHTAWVASSDFSVVSGRAVDGNQTPLFFYACWATLKAGGESALSLRLPSLLCGLVLLLIVPLWVYRRTASAASLLIVSAWFLFDYDVVYYASEARPYAMVQLLGAIQAGVFWLWIENLFFDQNESRKAPNEAKSKTNKSSRTKWLGGATAVLAALIFYVHPTGMLLMVAEAVLVLGLMGARLGRRVPWGSLLAVAGLCAALVSPGILMVGLAWQRRDNWASVSDAQKVLGDVGFQALLMMVVPLLAVLVDQLFLRRQNRFSDEAQRRFWSRLTFVLFVALWAIIPASTIIGVDALGLVSLAITRYSIVGAVAFPIFAALVVGAVGSESLRLLVSVAIVGTLVWLAAVPWQLQSGGLRNENWQGVVEAINGEDERSLPVFLLANLIEDNAAETDRSDRFQQYLGFPLKGIPSLNRPQRIVPRPTQGKILSSENIEAMIDRGGGFVVVREREAYRDPIRLEIFTALQEHGVAESSKLFAAPITEPRPNNVHLFWIQINDQ